MSERRAYLQHLPPWVIATERFLRLLQTQLPGCRSSTQLPLQLGRLPVQGEGRRRVCDLRPEEPVESARL